MTDQTSPAKLSLEAVLWDLDGTLADTADDIARLIDATLVAFGLPSLGVDRVRQMVGGGAPKLVNLAVTAAGGEPGPAHLDHFRALYRVNPRGTAALYPGIRELLDAIRLPQAVVTNKPHDVSEALIQLLEIDSYFGTIVGGDTLPQRKPSPEPVLHAMEQIGVQRAVLIGDSPHDVGAAKAAGILSIGVTWGILQPEGADFIVHDVPQLQAVLARLDALRYR